MHTCTCKTSAKLRIIADSHNIYTKKTTIHTLFLQLTSPLFVQATNNILHATPYGLKKNDAIIWNVLQECIPLSKFNSTLRNHQYASFPIFFHISAVHGFLFAKL